jgi:hypothetical protein
MTKTGRAIAVAFRDGRALRIKHTQASPGGRVYLHGNIIAHTTPHGVVMLSLAGWPTAVTRDRLNAILEAYGSPNRFFQDKGRQYYGRRATFHNTEVEIGPNEWVPMAGPLGMLALQAARAARTQEDQALPAARREAA